MDILDSHIHKLRFRLDGDAPTDFKKRWKKFKRDCENGHNKQIVEHWKGYCKLEQNRILPYLDRIEGGIGGNNNTIHKQIRFRFGTWRTLGIYDDADIVMDRIENTTTERWTYEELDDLVDAFIKTANNNVEEECVKGCIEMVNAEQLRRELIK